MKSGLLASLISLMMVCLHHQPQPGCSQFKTGKYKLVDLSIRDSFIIDRSDSIQTETDLATGETLVFKVQWLDDCTYILRIVKGPAAVMDFYDHKFLKVQIIETYSDGYKFEAWLNGKGKSLIQTVRRV
jgi:hypothetical protein